MAIGLVIRFKGVKASQYDAVQRDLGLEGPKATWPDGLISHAAGPTDGGWCVVDVWQSQARFDAFMAAKLGAALGKNGLPRPEITHFEVHNRYAA